MIKKLLCLTLPAVLVAAPLKADTETRHIMQDVADALEVLLPLSLDGDEFLSPDNRERVLAHLEELEESADGLAEHGAESESLDFQLLAAAFARAVSRIREDFQYVHPAEARYVLVDLTQHCVACHSRDPAMADFPLSNALNRYLVEEPLDEREQAHLQVALRQFDDAMVTWEELMSSAASQPVDLALDGSFVEYLTVAVRVQEAYSRAARQLEELAGRETVPFYLERRLGRWVDDLEALERSQGQEMRMARAREIFLGPDTRPGLLWDDDRLVKDLALSASLRRMVAAGDRELPPAELAEAYYMLGVLEARTINLYSALPSMERFWEAAVRAAPTSSHAVEAYALMEEYAATTYSGELPFERTDDTFSRLAELRALIGLD